MFLRVMAHRASLNKFKLSRHLELIQKDVRIKWIDTCRKINIPCVLDMMINILHLFPSSSMSSSIKLRMGNSESHILGSFRASILECNLGSIDELLVLFGLFLKFLFIWERESTRAGEVAEREGETDSLLSRETNPGLHLRIPRSWHELKADA